MKELLINLEEEGIKPEYGDLKKAHFESGYESYEFYNAILKTAKKRLYVFGRKNRKLFSKNNTKIKKLIEDGIDFKCLFLSDKSNPVLVKCLTFPLTNVTGTNITQSSTTIILFNC